MVSKYRILSFHHIPNNGAFLFTYSLLNLFRQNFRSAQVKVLDYRSPRLMLIEGLKQFKFFQRLPLFYWRRSRLWKNTLKRALDLDRQYPRLARYGKMGRHFSENYDAMIVGMDVWCIVEKTERPPFPNLYWLPGKMDSKKIAYGVSAYNSDVSLIHKHGTKISEYLNDFDIIGSRDRFTHDMVSRYRTRASGMIEMIPDPTFLYDIEPTGVKGKLTELGVNSNRPVIGILIFGQQELSEAIKQHYQSRGYQIVALSMYNSSADINLGHVLDPFEWAETFKLLTFCITDRYHGTIFCLKNQTPFISIEKDTHLPKSQSKLLGLLEDFNLSRCYANPEDEDFNIPRFLYQAGEIEANWAKSLKDQIPLKIEKMQTRHHDFIRRMKLDIAV
jgi:hypothetical protein